MQFVGTQLQTILEQQQHEVAVYDSRSFTRGTVRPSIAMKLVAGGLYVGIGSRKRIRAIRPLNSMMTISQLHQASHMTRRPTNESGELFAPDWVREHRK